MIYPHAVGQSGVETVRHHTLGNGAWAVSSSQPLSTAIPSVLLGAGVTASITFTSSVATLGSSVQIDDLLIDPYRRG